jgi:RNA polymerase sigma-70 factor (sigma-E family)
MSADQAPGHAQVRRGAGSAEEFTEFVRARLPGLRRAAFLLCGDWSRGDDIVQRALTDAYVGWDRVRRADNPDAYLRTVLVHRWLDERRRRWSTVWLVDAVPDRAADPAHHQPDVDEALDVRAALARLAPRQRAVLVLRFFCDMSVEDTAAALRCSAGTVKSQTSVALAAMRRHLASTRTELP